MIRKITEADKSEYAEMVTEFYNSDAVIKPIPRSFIESTFEELMKSDVYAEAFIIEHDGKTVGYALLAKTFSQEAGGLCIWIEELFVKSEFRGKGFGKEFFEFLFKNRPAKRYRLEIEPENEAAVALYKAKGFDFFEYGQMVKE